MENKIILCTDKVTVSDIKYWYSNWDKFQEFLLDLNGSNCSQNCEKSANCKICPVFINAIKEYNYSKIDIEYLDLKDETDTYIVAFIFKDSPKNKRATAEIIGYSLNSIFEFFERKYDHYNTLYVDDFNIWSEHENPEGKWYIMYRKMKTIFVPHNKEDEYSIIQSTLDTIVSKNKIDMKEINKISKSLVRYLRPYYGDRIPAYVR